MTPSELSFINRIGKRMQMMPAGTSIEEAARQVLTDDTAVLNKFFKLSDEKKTLVKDVLCNAVYNKLRA